MRITSPLTVLVLAAGILLLLAAPAVAGGGGHGKAACRPTSEGQRLGMLDSCFDGVVHQAPTGTTLTVTNRGELPHTVTAVDGSFDSGVIQPGETFQIELDQAGDLPIYCTLHGTKDGAGMSGVVEVTDGASAQLASTASGTGGSGSPVAVLVAGLTGVAVGAYAERRRSRRVTG